MDCETAAANAAEIVDELEVALLGVTRSWADPGNRLTAKVHATDLPNKVGLGFGVTSAKTAVTYPPPRIQGGSIAFAF